LARLSPIPFLYLLNGGQNLRVESTSRSRAFSPVIAAILISGIVLAVGGAVWAFSQGAMTITAENYAESVINMTDTICERFIVEQVIYDGTKLHIWIFNYGDIDIEVNVTYPDNSVGWREVSSEHLEEIFFDFDPGDEIEVGIKVESRRENDAYYRFVVPS